MSLYDLIMSLSNLSIEIKAVHLSCIPELYSGSEKQLTTMNLNVYLFLSFYLSIISAVSCLNYEEEESIYGDVKNSKFYGREHCYIATATNDTKLTTYEFTYPEVCRDI